MVCGAPASVLARQGGGGMQLPASAQQDSLMAFHSLEEIVACDF